MKLRADARQPPRRAKRIQLALFNKSCVRRRQAILVHDRFSGGQYRGRKRWIAQQQSRPGHWREGRGNLQLGIILPARPFKRIRPMMVEHIFALAVALKIRRKRSGGNAVRIADHDRRRRPARAGADTARFLQRRQKRVGHKRIAPRVQRIPLVGGNIADLA